MGGGSGVTRREGEGRGGRDGEGGTSEKRGKGEEGDGMTRKGESMGRPRVALEFEAE